APPTTALSNAGESQSFPKLPPDTAAGVSAVSTAFQPVRCLLPWKVNWSKAGSAEAAPARHRAAASARGNGGGIWPHGHHAGERTQVHAHVSVVFGMSQTIQLEAALLPVCSPYLPEDVADLAERAVRLHRIQHRMHEVLVPAAGVFDSAQLFLHLALRPVSLHGVEALHLVVHELVIDLQRGDRLVALLAEGVDADDLPLAGVDLPLPLIGAVGDLALRITLFDRADDAAVPLDLRENLHRPLLGLVGEVLDEVRPRQGVDDAIDAALVGEDLLRAQRDGDCVLGGKRVRLVEGIGVER